MGVHFFDQEDGGRLAYVHVPAQENGKALPSVMFLGGFRSDMEGTKAVFLENCCRARGQEFVRFDYSGHGQSSGAFVDGTIGRWKNDARDILDRVVDGDVILVGSSMGGWISFLLLLERAERIRGVVGIAAAPDFTKDIEAQMSDAQKMEMQQNGRVETPNDYSDEPYVFTKALIDDGRVRSLLHMQHKIDVPMILLQGKLDADVPWEKALRIQKTFTGAHTEVVFIDDGDHRLSRDQDLALIDQSVQKISGF